MDIEDTSSSKKYYDNISVAKRTKQVVYLVQQHDKYQMLMETLANLSNKQLIILVKSKKTADILMEFLNKKELKSLAIHGNHRSSQIQAAQIAFNSKELSILITTDRILDKLVLENVQAVINYDLPLEASDYFNRLILVDETGESISFINEEDKTTLEIIEYMIKSKIKEEKIESFKHTDAPIKMKKDKTKKPPHKKVAKAAKNRDKIKSEVK